jgi:FKBP-type peptidyl-prolyl cis-trans isomerase
MKSARIIFSLLSGAILLFACNDSVNIDFKKTRGGVPYKIFPAGKSKDSIKVDDFVKLHRIVKVKDSIIANTYLSVPAYETVRLPSPSYGDPLPEILVNAHEGDSIYYVQAMDSFIAHNPQILSQTPFRNGDELVTTVRIVKVFKSEAEARAEFMKDNAKAIEEGVKKAEAAEKEQLAAFRKDSAAQAQLAKDHRIIEAHLKSNGINAQKTDWGVYVNVLNPGQGPKPTIGKFVRVQYKGTHLSGEQFDAGVYDLQIGTGGAIKGFEDGIRQLGKGGRAVVFVPSVHGYGAGGSPPKILSDENLIFELELLDISDVPLPPRETQPSDTSHAGHGHN